MDDDINYANDYIPNMPMTSMIKDKKNRRVIPEKPVFNEGDDVDEEGERVHPVVDGFLLAYDLVSLFFQAEDGIRDAQESRGLGVVYKRQPLIYFENDFRSSAICRQSSRVGEMTIACVVRSVGSVRCSNGMPKAAVLPVPVCASAITSLPLPNKNGITSS